MESRLALVRRARRIFRELGTVYPHAHCELEFSTPFELLVATVLSAQTTDVRVNQVTPELFRRWPDAAALAAAPLPEVEQVIRSTGFFRAKAVSITRLAAALVTDHAGAVPARLEDLVALPGVGRKTANVVLGDAFDVPGLTVDTHFGRLVRRFRWTRAEDPVVVEREVGDLFPQRDWNQLNHRLIWHGRRRCHARRPACGACPIAHWCPAFGEGETDPVKALSLVKEPS